MTETARNHKANNTADIQKARRLQAVRILERLIKHASDPKFTGSVMIKLEAKNGRIGTPRSEIGEYHENGF